MTEQRITDPVTGGAKGTKPERFSLIPRGPLGEVARLYAFGATKYEAHNWAKGYAWHLSAEALERHLALWLAGEDTDPESGCHHLASVVFHAFSLMEFSVTHQEGDDRYLEGARPDVPLAEQAVPSAATILDDMAARHRELVGLSGAPYYFNEGERVRILHTPGVGARLNGLGVVVSPGDGVEHLVGVVPDASATAEEFLYEASNLAPVTA